jgi:uracil-DNA glycosylase
VLLIQEQKMPTPRGLQHDLAFNEALAQPSGVPRLAGWTPQDWPVSEDWQPLVTRFLSTEAGHKLARFISARLAVGTNIYPPEPLRALRLTPRAEVKVVILGQDPYHGPGQAEGLAFSVKAGTKLPPSLRNIYKELARDPLLNTPSPWIPPTQGSLACWAKQGVLLLNTSLTVEDGAPGSHAKQGWESLTDDIVGSIAGQTSPIVFLLWGAHAQAKLGLIQTHSAPGVPHQILTANHPSPLSASRPPTPFLGCGHFGLANVFLQQHGIAGIDWHCVTERSRA